jgi:uncharacterized protein
MLELALFLLLSLLAEIMGTLGGFGSSAFFVPMAGFFYDLRTVLALTGILHVFSNTSKLLLFYKHTDKRLLLLLGIPSIIMVAVGALLTGTLPEQYTNAALGIFLISLASYFLYFPYKKVKATTSNALFGGGLAGFLAGLIGTGGAIRGMSLAAFNLEKSTYVATSAAIDFGVDLLRTGIYLFHGFLEPDKWFYVPFLVVVAFLGSWLGKLLLDKISQNTFRTLVLILLGIMGVVTLAKAGYFWFS